MWAITPSYDTQPSYLFYGIQRAHHFAIINKNRRQLVGPPATDTILFKKEFFRNRVPISTTRHTVIVLHLYGQTRMIHPHL